MTNDRAFLTDRRREFLRGDFDLSETKDRQLKYRIKNESATAIKELTDIAQSPHIDNSEALPPEQVGELIEALFIPTIEPDGYDEYRKNVFYHVRRALDRNPHDD